MQDQIQNNVNQNQFQNFNNQAQGNNNLNQNMMNMGFMSQMSPQQIQMIMNMKNQQLFEMQKQQAREIGQMLRRQKNFIEEMKRREEQMKKEDREIILFFNHNYNILPLTFKQSTPLAEALAKYIEETHIQNPTFKHENKELKIDFSGRNLEDVNLINGDEITVIC